MVFGSVENLRGIINRVKVRKTIVSRSGNSFASIDFLTLSVVFDTTRGFVLKSLNSTNRQLISSWEKLATFQTDVKFISLLLFIWKH